MSGPAIVEFKAVTKRFGEGPDVLAGIDLAVPAGQFVSVIGPSGCGKSTLLRLIAGLSPVTSGTIVVDGQSPEQAATELAFVFQDPTLLPWRNVADNVALPLQLRNVPPPERASRRDEALRLVGLADRADAYPRQLSGGQKMRVSIARALTLAPKILLLDEPFGALDEMSRERLNEELLSIRDIISDHGSPPPAAFHVIRENQPKAGSSWTGFFVTHSVAEAVFLSDRILVLSGGPGRIHADIPITLPSPRTAELRSHPDYLALVARVSQVLRSVEDAAPCAPR